MNKYVFKTRYGTFERITKTKAQKLFVTKHQTIYIVADKCRCDYTHPMTYPSSIDYERAIEDIIDDTGLKNYFDNIVNSFQWYNCNYECGYRVAYYIKTDISED